MTTFQDPPPQSRRSARQTERGGAVEGFEITDFSQAVPPAQTQPPAQPQGQGYPSQQYPSQQYPTQQYLGQQYPAQGFPQSQSQLQQPDPSSSARRARDDVPQNPYGLAPEPLNYATQGAPYATQQATPNYAASPTAAPGHDGAAYRVRDFSPDGGRASGRRAGAPPLVEPPASAAYDASAGDINYQTQGYGAAGTSAAAAPAAPVSRREQRQRQAEQQVESGDLTSQLTGQYPGQATGQLAYNPALLAQAQQQAPPPAQQQPVQTDFPQYDSGEVVTGYPATPLRAQPPPTSLSNAMAEFEALTRNGQPPGPAAAQRVPEANVVAPPAERPQAQQPQQAPAPSYVDPALAQSGARFAPAGHWSRQADLDDETQPWENTITREVGGGNIATTTSALVLPEIPRMGQFASALTSTGEVVLTGSIDLPRSLGSTGGDARLYDDPGVDRMFDSQDAEFTGTDSAPVRAIRAVSTHSGSRGVIHANKPRGNRLITVVFIVTAVLAVAVVGMLVVSISLGLF